MKPSGQDFKKVATTLVDILFIGLMLHLSHVKKWTVNQYNSHMNWYCVYNHIKLYSPFQRSAHILQKSRDWCQQIKFLCSENMVFTLIQNNYEIAHRPIFLFTHHNSIMSFFSTTYSKFLWIIKSCPSTKKVDFLFLIKTTLTTFYLSQTRRTCFFLASKNPPVRKKNNPDEKQAHGVKSCSLFGQRWHVCLVSEIQQC